tara:strand:- start:388 stop:1470 length:1083 start_codon:yes stop_codon:yes gene_type:complete
MSYIIPENALPSKVLYIDSRDADRYLAVNGLGYDVHSYFSYILKESIEIPPNQRALISLHSATIPFSFYNIREGINDRIPIRVQQTLNGVGDFSHTLTIPPANYTAYTLATHLKTAIPLLFVAETTFTFIPVFNTDTQKYTFTIAGTGGDIAVSLKMTWDFSIVESSANIETGFRNEEVVFLYTQGVNPPLSTNSVNVVDINGSIHGVYVRTNVVSDSTLDSQNGTFSNILSRIPINVQSGGIIFQTASNSTHKAIVDMNYLNALTIRLTDERNRIIDLNGLHFQIAISMDFTYATKPKQINQGGLTENVGGDSYTINQSAGQVSKSKVIRAQQQQAEIDAQPVRRGPGRPRRVGRPTGS